jgi:hypothetical protein
VSTVFDRALPDVTLTHPAALLCLKGRAAPQVLGAAGIEVPPVPNSFRRWGDQGWCLRLGAGEYLLADDSDTLAFDGLRAAAAREPHCHPLLRSDRCLHLHGPRATDLLLHACDIDERQLLSRPDALALVMLADVSVVLHSSGSDADGPRWRIWCDPTYATHLREAFARIDARFQTLTPTVSSPRRKS